VDNSTQRPDVVARRHELYTKGCWRHDDGSIDPPSWDDIVQAWGHPVLAHERFGDYQGDHVYVLVGSAPDVVGISVIGYGSCSGCDVLASCDYPEVVVELAERTLDQVRWFATAHEADEAFAAMVGPDGELQWWGHAVGFDDAVTRLRAALAQMA